MLKVQSVYVILNSVIVPEKTGNTRQDMLMTLVNTGEQI